MAAKKTVDTTSVDVRNSVSSMYASLLERRQAEREVRLAKKMQDKEIRGEEKEKKKIKDDGTKMTKEERRQAELDSWKEIVVGLTGDDLEYSSPKKRKKKYHKWIDDDAEANAMLTPKPKKHKKRNYNKEFEGELNMLKSLVADQNRFSADLLKRFQVAAGPATKDAMPLNKTLVELASAINASRSNSLGVLREIGNIKKTIADLYMKQAKADAESGSSGFDSRDVGLMGSNIAAQIFGDNPVPYAGNTVAPTGYSQDPGAPIDTGSATPIVGQVISQGTSVVPQSTAPEEEFDPSTWVGPESINTGSVAFETIPHTTVVEWHKADGKARFKAIRNDDGTELVGCPVPTCDPSKLVFNEKDLTVKGEFDEVFKLEIL
ncbi:MAG: hypothetical protein NC548_12960 [Lachnospiraceae bacterium]|nr:hypothetical protein [Lachnospiraceae bacterium]MCM1230699.1 hypothetical protein [Ruminococcus flavefaciens]